MECCSSAVLNTVVYLHPSFTWGGLPVPVLDVVGSIALVGMAALLVRAVWTTAVELDRADRAASTQC